jgi:hypothetical protein
MSVRTMAGKMANAYRLALVLCATFGAPTPVQALEAPCAIRTLEHAGAPDTMEQHHGQGMAGGDTVRRIGNRLVRERTDALRGGPGKIIVERWVIPVSAVTWPAFWSKVDALGVWCWKSHYSNPAGFRTDRDGWSLELRIGTRHLKAEGYDAHPASLYAFEAELEQLFSGGQWQREVLAAGSRRK